MSSLISLSKDASLSQVRFVSPSCPEVCLVDAIFMEYQNNDGTGDPSMEISLSNEASVVSGYNFSSEFKTVTKRKRNEIVNWAKKILPK